MIHSILTRILPTLALLLAIPAAAVQTSSVRDDDAAAFDQGELTSVALTSDGYLVPSYERRQVGPSGSEIIWDMVEEESGAVLCATGHSGRLVRVIDENTSQTVATLDQPQLTSLLRLGDGSTLIGAAPGATIYRLGVDDQLTTWTQLDAAFIWRMALDAQGNVWAATGSDGRLFRLREEEGAVQSTLVHDSDSANLLDLWIDRTGLIGRAGLLYVAGQDPGLLYRVDPARPEQVEVVFNSEAEEIRALLPTADGLVLALNTERAPTPQALQLTMRMAGQQAAAAQAASQSPSTPEGGRDMSRVFAPARERSYGQPRSQVVLLDRAGYSRVLWTASERPIHALAAAPGGGVLAAAGNQGRLFKISMDGQHALVADLREEYLVRMLDTGGRYLIGAARNGVVYEMSRERAAEAIFVSRPIDGRVPVRWGAFHWHGRIGAGQEAQVQFRTGNSGDAESSLWSDWSTKSEVRPHQPARMPDRVARYAQYRLTLRQQPGSPEPVRMDHAELFFIEPNRPPRVSNIKVDTAGQPGARPAQPSSNSGSSAAPRPPGAPSAGGSPPAAGATAPREARSNTMTYQVGWEAGDPNNDTLQYELWFRGEEESNWKLIADKLTATKQPLTTAMTADGRYRFKVIASDALANPPGNGLTHEAISEMVVIDNTPPIIDELRAQVRGRTAEISMVVHDAVSLVAAVQFDLNNGDSYPLLPVDGLLDQSRERFQFELPDLEPGEQVVTIAATDREGNTAVRKIVFTIQ